jgi:hypothetical protein
MCCTPSPNSSGTLSPLRASGGTTTAATDNQNRRLGEADVKHLDTGRSPSWPCELMGPSQDRVDLNTDEPS